MYAAFLPKTKLKEVFVFMSNNTAIFTTVLELTQHKAAYETKIQICLGEKNMYFKKQLKQFMPSHLTTIFNTAKSNYP